MLPDEDYVPISALEHYSYCPRQCALIHAELIYEENVFTLRGNRMHERTDQPITRREHGIRIERALPLWSEEFGIVGVGDVIEFHPDGSIMPIEYKPGARPVTAHDDIQLCAQALCLEEMFDRCVGLGVLYSGARKRRRNVNFDDKLRRSTKQLILDVRKLMGGTDPLPPAVNDNRCNSCSLREACMPETISSAAFVHRLRLFQPAKESEIRGEG